MHGLNIHKTFFKFYSNLIHFDNAKICKSKKPLQTYIRCVL